MIKIYLLVLLVIILYYLIKKIKIENFSNKQKKYKIAIYSYNFGNYRNELGKNIDKFNYDKNFDYYFYTDQEKLKSTKWNIIKVPLRPRTEHMNANRVTTKYYKFKKIPKELNQYDYIIHIDSGRVKYLNKISYDKIENIINDNKEVLFFGRKQPVHKNILHEAESDWHIKKHKNENINNRDRWVSKLRNENYKQSIPHVELCFYLIKNCDYIKNLFSKVYDKLFTEKLCRDQFIFCYILDKNNFDINKFKIIKYF